MWSSIYREKFCPFNVRRDTTPRGLERRLRGIGHLLSPDVPIQAPLALRSTGHFDPSTLSRQPQEETRIEEPKHLHQGRIDPLWGPRKTRPF